MHSKFALPLGLYNEFCISSPLQALEIRIPAAVLHFKPFAGTRNSNSRRGSSMNSAFQTPCGVSKLVDGLSAAGAPGGPPEWTFSSGCSLEERFFDPGPLSGLAST